MKLPSHLRKFRKFTVYSLAFYVLILVMFSPVPQIYAASTSLGNSPWFSTEDLSNSRMETEIIVVDPAIKKDIRPEEVGFPYTPQTQSDDTSDQFSTTDYLTVNHNDVFNLTNFSDTGKINNSYSISSIADYTNDSLNNGIAELKSIDDYYTIEDEYDGVVTFDKDDYYTFAQAFDVAWDYAFFYGSELFLTYDTGFTNSLEEYELSLHLVSANSGDGNPNMTNIISNCTSNPFSESNKYADAGFQFFDFTDIRITKGTYYIVANLSQIDTGTDALRHFQWAKNEHSSDGVDDGKTLTRVTFFPGMWSVTPTSYDLALINYLYPVDSNNDSIIFNGPDEIDLKDNGVGIATTTSSIASIGNHELTSNTSVQITFNNSYTFSKTFIGNDVYSVFSATNASYWSYSIDWDINWTSSSIDITPYTNLDRHQVVFTPTDWHDTIFTFYYNETNTLTGSRETEGYRLDLGANNSAGNWLLSTTSPNYLSDLELLDDTTPTERFFLGYWIGGATDSTGFVGSKIVANTLVQGDGGGTPYNETTGSLNYTLYDINGNIIPLKSSLPANLIYTDTTSYTLSGITQVSAGFYTPEIYFDPSASGSDLPGFWTAAVFWQNGTEVGFYSQRIVVQTQTELVLEWEEEPLIDNWITTDISRKGLDSILVRGSYYNISEPYTIGTKNLIPSVAVSYTVHNATWNKNDVFNDYAPDYNTSILIDANIDVGTYTVDFLGTGAFLENNSTSFTLTVFYELSLVPEYTNYQTNYTNNVLYYLNLYDVTASSNLSLTPDDMTVTITNGTDFPLSSPVDYTFTYQAPTEQWFLDISTSTNSLVTGLYSVEISVYLNNYRANYSAAYVSDVYTFEITAPKTSIQKTGDATTIYVYHDATFSFRFLDTNHSAALFGANVVASASESNIDFSYNIIGDTYYVTVTDNNPLVSSITIYVDVSLTNYESVISFTLGELSVLTIQTSLTEVSTPTEVYVGYTTSIIVQFNDITHTELINVGTGTFVTVTSNSSSYTDEGYVYLGSGRYNVSFINNDYTIEGINVTITIGKTGYENASISFQIQVISISTDSQLVDSADQDITIYYGEGTSVEVLYWDDILGVNITSPDIFIDGNISVTFGYNFADNITTITINPIYSVGTFYLNITIIEPGYAPQMIQILITTEERVTDLIITAGDVNTTEYASEDIDISFDFRDVVGVNISIESALVSALFAQDNSSLEIDDYFNSITNTTFGDYYIVSFNADPSVAIGTVYILEITFSKYGYQSQTIIIRITFYPAVDYDISIEIDGEIRQLETVDLVVLLQNITLEVMAEGSDVFIHIAPTPHNDFVNITYTFTFANGTTVTYWELVQLTPNTSATGYIATLEIYIPWHVTNISYSVTYAPSGIDQYVIVAKSTTENQVVVANPTFVALLTYFFREYTLYMIIGIVAIALIIIAIIIIQFTIVRPKKQKKKEGKRKYLDKISKILTSVLSLRKVIIVHTESGLPIYEWDLGGEITVDSSLVTGFLQAVAGMGSEISGGQTGAIKKLDYGQFVVSSASKDCICAYLFSTSEVSIDVETGLASFVEWFEKRFKSVLHDWGGVTDEFTNNSRQIIDTLSEELFIWTLHPLSINTLKEKDVHKLNTFGQKIFNFIKDYKEVTISVALEYFNKTPLEETLSTLFNMIDEKYLLRMRLR